MKIKERKDQKIRMEAENESEKEIIQRVKRGDCLSLEHNESKKEGVAVFNKKIIEFCRARPSRRMEESRDEESEKQ